MRLLPASIPLPDIGRDDSGGAPFGRPSRTVGSDWGTVDGALFGRTPSDGDTNPDIDDARGGDIDDWTSGLVRGGVHEWFGAFDPNGAPPARRRARDDDAWSPPLLLLTHLAGRAVDDALVRGAAANVLWIGRRVWPYPRTLIDGSVLEEATGTASGDPDAPDATRILGRPALLDVGLELDERAAHAVERSPLAERSLFVDPRDDGQRLWAIDTALRCPGVTAVVADGSGLGMAASRRLQLAAQAAAERGGGALVLLARPPTELGEISAATTRWAVARAPARAPVREPDGNEPPRWSAHLLRVKGAQVLRTDRVRRPAVASAPAWERGVG